MQDRGALAEEQDSVHLGNQALWEMRQSVQTQLADIHDELLDLARLLDRSMTALQTLPAGPGRVSTEMRVLAEVQAHNRGAMTRLRCVQQGFTKLHVSLDHVPAASLLAEKGREHLSALFEVSQALNSTLDLDELLNRAIDMVIETTQAERGFLMLCDNGPAENATVEAEPTLNFQVARNMDRQTIAGPSFEISRGVVSQVLAAGKPILTTNAQADPRFDTRASVIGYRLRSILCAALSVKDRVTGVIYVDSRLEAGLFSPRDLDFLVAFANQAAMAIENARLYQAVSDGYLDTIKALAAAIDARDPRTFGHSGRVTQYAMRMAEVLQLTDQERETLRYAAILHDIGKIGVSDAILLKPDLLTTEEEGVMCSHPVIGTLIVDGIQFLKDTRPLIRHHHERWDGTGYPDKLAGEDIPLRARILSIADAYDAMLSVRPYRDPLSVTEAVAELRAGRGTQFDPALVDIFIREIVSQPR